MKRGIAILGMALMAMAAEAQTPAAPAPAAAPASAARGLTIPKMEIDGPWDSTIRLEFFNRLRGEFVSWFEPAPTSATPDYRYDFLANKFQLGLRVTRDPYEVFLQFQNTTLAEVPANAVGVGGSYYQNTPETDQNGAFLRQGWIQIRNLFGFSGLTLKGGRQLYLDGFDAPAKNPSLRWIQAQRFAQRLLGPFDYTNVGRSFTGGQVSKDWDLFNLTAFGFTPTWGGFEVDGNRQLDIAVGGAALYLKDAPAVGNTVGRFFAFYYDDRRDIVYLDNRPLAQRNKDRGRPANIFTIGANAAHVHELGPGLADGALYAYGQLGKWQSLTQEAWAYGVEGGYRFPEVWAQPWTRIGINSGSGDGDPNDDTHGTFYQMLPTAWLYAMFPFYNMMNNQDVFIQNILDPHPRVTLRSDFHWLRVNSGDDFAYFGGGPTQNKIFGYGGTAAKGQYELAYLLHFLLSVRPTDFFSINAVYGHAWGQGVINENFAGNGGDYGFLEGILAF
ncbi:alginate export family protein [Candidatus Binatia bacterium]|nr:alginate export family protein [Candidatus Binatia bacterium]